MLLKAIQKRQNTQQKTQHQTEVCWETKLAVGWTKQIIIIIYCVKTLKQTKRDCSNLKAAELKFLHTMVRKSRKKTIRNEMIKESRNQDSRGFLQEEGVCINNYSTGRVFEVKKDCGKTTGTMDWLNQERRARERSRQKKWYDNTHRRGYYVQATEDGLWWWSNLQGLLQRNKKTQRGNSSLHAVWNTHMHLNR